MDVDEERAALRAEHPEFSPAQIELTLCCLFSSEICEKLATPSDWIRDPRTLLSDLRHLERWRSEIISGDPRKCELFTIHRGKSTLFTELRGTVQKMIHELRAVQATTSLPVSADRLETLWHNLEAVQFGSDDHLDEIQTAAYNAWRILKDETETMELFCQLIPGQNDRWSTGRVKADWIALRHMTKDQWDAMRKANPGRIQSAPGNMRLWQFKESLCKERGFRCPEFALK